MIDCDDKKYDFTFAHREEGFDDHIENSIRGYGNLLDDVVGLSRYFIEDYTNVYDLGCSTGKLTQRLIEENQDHCYNVHYMGIELAEGFYDDLDKRYENLCGMNPWVDVEFLKQDIRDTDICNASLITSIFTLQFMPRRDRLEVLESIYDGLNEGGAFIFAEKTVCENSRFQDMLTFNYYDYKRKSFNTDDIMDKERTLRHMLKPNTWGEILDMLHSVGFDEIQPFWRNHMFVGAIAVK
jgi:tRNA (cmo5U34)-methyltransferase